MANTAMAKNKQTKRSQFASATSASIPADLQEMVKNLQTKQDKSAQVIGISLHEFQGSKELGFILIPIEAWNLVRPSGGNIPVQVVVKGADETRSSYYERIEETGFAREIETSDSEDSEDSE